jgi:D-alanyl-D-alanine carboxypeptidase (penicillin-binding protein 5/6)
MKKWKRILSLLLICLLSLRLSASANGPEIESPAALLMEASTGTVLYEKEADTKRSPASVTKIMTALLIFEALEEGKLSLEEEVVTSAYAKSMGGSQVFLEEGEKQTVQTLLKCILVASGNDASVAMAEKLAGTEGEFVKRMNQKADELGMENTHFTDCCGLTDSEEHYTTPRDIALMSRELILRFPEVFDYTTIWMEEITHVTNKGSSEFGLTNTNKLLRSFEGCTGLKTGSTSKAKFCLSATAERNGIQLISVIMEGPDSKTRFKNAAELLNYGFGQCSIYIDENRETLPEAEIRGAIRKTVPCQFEREFRHLFTGEANQENIEKEIILEEEILAPLKKGEVIGKAVYRQNGTELGSVPIVCSEDVEKAGFLDYLKKIWDSYQKI